MSAYYDASFCVRMNDQIGRGGKRRVSGIYSIELIGTDKLYIGSTRNFNKRLNNHRRDLRLGRHRNRNLQLAFNKHGEDKFRIRVLEVCKEYEVVKIEDRWLAELYPSGRLFNLHSNASYSGNTFSRLTRKRISRSLVNRWSDPKLRAEMADKIRGKANGAKPFSLRSPAGIIHEGINREAFCRRYGLSSGQVSDMVHGKQRQVKGWTLPSPHPNCTQKDRKSAFERLRGSNSVHAILNEDDVIRIRARRASGEKRGPIAKDFGCDVTTISAITSRKNWSHLP